MPEFKEENFPGNSIIKKPKEEKKVSKVVKGTVVQRKEPLLDRIFGGDTFGSIGNYIVWDVLVPAAKSTISDIVTNSIDMIFYGEEGRSRSKRVRRDRDRSYVSYNSIYDGRRRAPSRREKTNKDRHNFEDIVFASRGDAEEVLVTLVEYIDQYELATVEDFYESVGLPSEYTDGKWGWESLERAQVKPTRGGFYLQLPSPVHID